MPSETSELDKKQNGTVIDEESKSRTRVSRACTRCRARKDRCDGQRPSCSACENAHATCSYEPATKKRGLPEGYVRGLEKLMALLMGKINGFEDSVSDLMRDHHSELLKIWNHSSIGEELHSTWKESKIIHELENLLSGLDQGASSGHKRKRDKEDDGDHPEDDVDNDLHTKPQYRLSLVDDSIQPTNGHAVAAAAAPPLPALSFELPVNATQLIDHYFAHTHCWFPIVDRPQVLRAYYQLSRGKPSNDKNGPAKSLLWAIFAYTSRHYQNSEFGTYTSDVVISPETNDQYRLAAHNLIPQDPHELTRTHAQACLVAALLDIGTGKWRSAWTLVGHAVRFVLCEASETKSTGKNDSALLQGCAILDIAIASHLGVVPHLRRTEFQPRSLMNEDGHEEWEPWNPPGFDQGQHREPSFAISCFNRLTEVFLINADVLILLTQPERLDRAYVQSLLAKLHQLQTTIPYPMPPSLQSPPHHIYLQLCHLLVQIRLVDLPVETGAGPLERARLACNVLGLLELCKNAQLIRLEHVPPFMVDCVESACRLARSSSSSFGLASGLPSYHEFNRTASELINSMAMTWPVFASLSSQQRSNSQSMSQIETPPFRNNNIISPHPISSPSTSEIPLQRQLHDNLEKSHRSSLMSMTGQSDVVASNSSLPDLNNWQYPRTRPDPTAFIAPRTDLVQLSADTSTGSIIEQNLHSISNLGSIDMNSSGPVGALGLSIAEPSPSFHGDEIDAIFHEMAHLDTNEWTSERTLGLKDFGFADDLTFQAFCNDPERLVTPNDGMQPTLSSNSRTWTFADTSLNLG